MSFLKQLQQSKNKNKNRVSNEGINNNYYTSGNWSEYFKKYQAKYKFKLPKDVVNHFTKSDNPGIIVLDNDGKRVPDEDMYLYDLSYKSEILTPKEVIDRDENFDLVKSNFKNLNPKEIKGFPITAGWLPIVEFDNTEWPVVIDLDPNTKGKLGQVISVKFPEGLLEVKLLANSWTEYLSNYANESFDEYGIGINENQNNSIVTDIDETDKVKEFEHYVLDEEKDDEANIYISEVDNSSNVKEGDVIYHRGDSLKEFSNEGLFDFFKRSLDNSIINSKMSYQVKIDTLEKAISTLPDTSNNSKGIKCNTLSKYVKENSEARLNTIFGKYADFVKLQTNNDKVLFTVLSSVNKELLRKNITDIGDYKIDYFFKATSQLLPESNSNNWFGYTKDTLGDSLIEFYETDYDYGSPFASNCRPMDTEKSTSMVFDAIKDIKGFKQLLLTTLKDSKVALDKYQKWEDVKVIDKGYYEYSSKFVDVFTEYKSIIHYNFEEYVVDGLLAISALYELLFKSTVSNSEESINDSKQNSLLDKLLKISSNRVSLEDEENKQDDTNNTEIDEDIPSESGFETGSETNQEEETDEGLSSGTEDSGDSSEETGGESNDSGEGEDSIGEDETEGEEIFEEREEEIQLDQPDKEKILIKNYLEPLLGEGVSKVKLFTADEVNRPLYHISMNPNIKTFTPQVSKRVLSKENRSIPRISTSTSLIGCLNGYQSLVSDMDGREAKNFSGVFTVYNLPYQYAIKPDAKLLSDVELSDEYWLVSWKKETFMTVPEVTATFTVPKIEKVYGNDGIDQTLHVYVKVRKGVLYIDHQRKLDVGCYHVKLEGYNFKYPLKNNNLIKVNQISENDYNRVTSLSMMIKTR